MLARDAQSSGDPVLAENYLQHAEHYNRIIMTFREQQMAQGGESAERRATARSAPAASTNRAAWPTTFPTMTAAATTRSGHAAAARHGAWQRAAAEDFRRSPLRRPAAALGLRAAAASEPRPSRWRSQRSRLPTRSDQASSVSGPADRAPSATTERRTGPSAKTGHSIRRILRAHAARGAPGRRPDPRPSTRHGRAPASGGAASRAARISAPACAASAPRGCWRDRCRCRGGADSRVEARRLTRQVF